MRLFRSEEKIPPGPGAAMPVEQLERLATRWYGDRLDPGWRPRSVAASQAILDEVGLSGDFWRLIG
jgi:hypothetical protein